MSRARDLADYVSTGVTSTELDKLDGLTATTDELNLVDGSATGPLSHRNCVINGGMQVFQRGIVNGTGVTGYAWKTGDADRFRFQPYNCGAYTIGTVDGPLAEAGIKNAYKIDCTTADASPASSDEVKWTYAFEGRDLQHFRKGTASAQPMILSFWIRAKIQNVANPTFNIHISDKDNAREVGAQYTVTASADTDSGWQRKIITIPADTTGEFDDDNAKSMEFTWWFGGGSNQTGGTTIAAWRANGSISDQRADSTGNVNLHTNNYVYITGVQLELGSATPFEHRSYADELRRCQRYFINYGISNSGGYYVSPENGVSFRHTTPGASNTITANACFANVDLPVRMRASGTFTALRAFNGSGSNLSNTNWAPFTPTGGAQQICIQKKTDDMTTNQTVIILSFSVDAEL